MTDVLDHAGRPRVAVTGIGVKAPAGNDVATLWANMLAGRSMARVIEQFDPTGLAVRFACEVRDFDPVEYFGPKEVRRQDRVTHFGFAAAVDAVNNAGELGAASGAAASAMSPEAAAAASAMLQSEAAATWRASAWGIASE